MLAAIMIDDSDRLDAARDQLGDFRVIGTGFNSSDETTEVIIGFSSIPKSSLTFNTSNPAANYVQFTVPTDLDLGANDVAMKSRKGWAFASGVLTVTE
jgi:hypothetical protein